MSYLESGISTLATAARDSHLDSLANDMWRSVAGEDDAGSSGSGDAAGRQRGADGGDREHRRHHRRHHEHRSSSRGGGGGGGGGDSGGGGGAGGAGGVEDDERPHEPDAASEAVAGALDAVESSVKSWLDWGAAIIKGDAWDDNAWGDSDEEGTSSASEPSSLKASGAAVPLASSTPPPAASAPATDAVGWVDATDSAKGDWGAWEEDDFEDAAADAGDGLKKDD